MSVIKGGLAVNTKELIKEQKVLDTTINRIKDQTYFITELLEKKKENMKTGNTASGDNIAYRRGARDQQLLKRAENEPYFGRFDIVSDEEGAETFYIGKQGVRDHHENIIVVDWRMPIASVFYNFTPSQSTQRYKVSMKQGKKEYTVDVTKKKEFTIKDQKIIKIIQQVSEKYDNVDVNVTITEDGEELTITDDFLRSIIENSETTGYLKEIIATIQQEQDKAIRQPIDRNVIIQGVAGSGKSSIALHRLSYLLYNHKEIKPEEVLILGPSHLFISSVKGLLPELNLEGIKQSTIQDLMMNYLQPVLKEKIDLSYNHYFEEILFTNSHERTRKIIEFKGSQSMALVLDIFISEIIALYKNNIQPITITDQILSKEELQKIYNGYNYLPFTKKVEQFILHVENHFKDKLKAKVEEVKEKEENVKKFIKDGGLTVTEHTEFIQKIESITNYKIKNLRNEFKKGITAWKTSMKGPDLLQLYKQVLTKEVLSAFKNEVGSEIAALFQEYQLKKLTYFDLAPLFYMYLLLYEKPASFKHIVVDEAQDLSYLHFASLQKITKTMTILGDKDQSVFMEYGQYDWSKLNTSLPNWDQTMMLTLDTSYRSTKEIIDVANTVLTNQNLERPNPIIPLNRNGEKVTFSEVKSGKELLDEMVLTIKEWKKKYKRIAIIHKDEQKAERLSQYLTEEYKRDVKYIRPDEEIENKSISVLTSYYSKGMEFDAVILCNVNEESFPKNELHARLLYVMLTRAQQEVKIFYQDNPSQLLKGLIDEARPKSAALFDDIL